MNHPLQQNESLSNYCQTLDELLILRNDIIDRAQTRMATNTYEWPKQDREYSAMTLSTYLAFRHHDIRPLQDKLADLGLSSLGRGESNILENIERVINLLMLLVNRDNVFQSPPKQWRHDKFSGKRILSGRNDILFGKAKDGQYTRIMITLPSEAARGHSLIKNLISNGMHCARINCAHDTSVDWKRMVSHIHEAKLESGSECKIFMDLAGMKIRTGSLSIKKHIDTKIRLYEGDSFELRCDVKSSVPASINPKTDEQTPAIVACGADAFLPYVKIGDSVWIDDGKVGCIIESMDERGLQLRVTHAGPKGVRIKADKGINFPDTLLKLPVLTEKDLADLDFVCEHADIVGLSFVQSAEDLQQLFVELSKRDSTMPVVAKIETRQAIEKLPEILFKGLSYPGEFAIMIARGDLAVELGSVRMAEIQEEILWLCEAAHVPVIWATQVLESLAKKGIVSRPEITDAAMSVRAECVMLNKGDYINSAVLILRDILSRMQAHQYKKVSRLRALHW